MACLQQAHKSYKNVRYDEVRRIRWRRESNVGGRTVRTVRAVRAVRAITI